MLITTSNLEKKTNSTSCVVEEYKFNKKNASLAKATIKGRYPEKGFAVNDECDMIYYALSGTCEIHYKDNIYKISKGDACLIEKKNMYWVEGTIELLIFNSPAWHINQYRQLNK
ncbi:hypothetical protein HOK51_00515 [Candidatus Woesearchaeota archaeon]|jgi:mannose-6-phosphate isomerase-like protein (cupin superfamily)|nr:hypothetical protein [Candidatus Woesearchaeota archaeon]MBT6518296.1 hypothetical protein [Candidatus Woesearchaeota archaeon]MBT7367079.1 hypothetical protein [Candidatus Woesearchaeota archaeon]